MRREVENMTFCIYLDISFNFKEKTLFLEIGPQWDGLGLGEDKGSATKIYLLGVA